LTSERKTLSKWQTVLVIKTEPFLSNALAPNLIHSTQNTREQRCLFTPPLNYRFNDTLNEGFIRRAIYQSRARKL